jgi:hypothetical protein
VCAYIYIYVCVCVCAYVCVCARVYICISFLLTFGLGRVWVCVYLYIYVCVCIYACVCIYVYSSFLPSGWVVYVCVCVFIYMCVFLTFGLGRRALYTTHLSISAKDTKPGEGRKGTAQYQPTVSVACRQEGEGRGGRRGGAKHHFH